MSEPCDTPVMAKRREDGALEAEVLHRLWAAGGSMTPAEMLESLGGDLAYTTITTVLTRLWGKGLVERLPAGRGFSYRAVVSEAEHAASRIRAVLGAVQDREGALAHFVGALDKRDEKALRKVLRELDSQ